MPYIEAPVIRGEPLCRCIIASPENKNKWGIVTALVDTGATRSCISAKAAAEMSIPCTNFIPVIGIHGARQTKAYEIHMALYTPQSAGKPANEIQTDDIQDIDDRLLHQEVLACEFDKTDEEYDLIIGMDYLSLCTLFIANGLSSSAADALTAAGSPPCKFPSTGDAAGGVKRRRKQPCKNIKKSQAPFTCIPIFLCYNIAYIKKYPTRSDSDAVLPRLASAAGAFF